MLPRFIGILLFAVPISASDTVPRLADVQRGVEIDFTLPAPGLLSRDAPGISARNVLGSRDEEELIRKGFPAQLRFSTELWPASSFLGKPIRSVSWKVIVAYEPLEKNFLVVRHSDLEGGQSLGSYREYRDVLALISRPYQPPMRGPSDRGRYFYSVTLELERMAENDLAEMRSWLGSAMQPERSAGSAVVSFFGSLVRSLIGAGTKRYQGRSAVFEIQ